MAPGPAAGESVPRISVVVPVFRQWDEVRDLLAALAVQEGAPVFEIVLADNDPGMTGGAARPETLGGARIVPAPGAGSYAARNTGAAAARGGLLAFTDADCRPEPGWLAALAAADTGAGLLAGPVDIRARAPQPELFEAHDMVRGIPQERYVSRGYAAAANLAVPAAIFRRLGGFDPGRLSGGDAEFCRRAGAAGVPIAFVPGARVVHPARASWAEVATKARRIRGAQLTQGPARRRLIWAGYTLLPPFRDLVRFARAPQPAGLRLRAMAVQVALWGVELAEMVRVLILRGPAERR